MGSRLLVGMMPLCFFAAEQTCAGGTQPEGDAKDTVYQMSPIIVTATQARDRHAPVTFTDLTSQEIKQRYSMQDVPVLLSELPSVTTYSENGNGIGYNYINLRGFDQRRISVMINGVPQNDPEDHNVYWIDFPDLMASTDNVQIQRGAGSAFYGPPAIGGSVNLVTNPFRTTPSVVLETMMGFQEFGDSSKPLALNTRKYDATFNSGIVGGRYAVYGHLGKILSDGYRVGSDVDLNSYFLGAIRLDNNMTTRFHFYGGPLEDGLAYNGLPKSVNGDKKARRQNLYTVEDTSGHPFLFLGPRRPQETESFSQPHYEVIHEWRVSPTVTLHNSLFYYSGEGWFDYDASWADTATLRIGYNYGIPATTNPANTLVRGFVGNKQWGWLPRVEIDHGTGTLTVGGEMRFHRSTHWGRIEFGEDLPPGLDPDYHFYEYNGERDILSLYGHEMLRLRDDLALMTDVQVAYNRYGISNEKYLGNNFSLSYLFVNPRLGVNYSFNEEWNSYLSVAYTSREPRMRNLYAAEDSYFGAIPQFKADTTNGVVRYDFSQPLVKPEHLLDLEMGARWKGGSDEGTVNVYWMEFTNELVNSGQVDIFGQPVTGNAARTRHIGLEVEGSVTPVTDLTVSGNVSISHNTIVHHTTFEDRLDTTTNTAKAVPVALDGNPIAGFPASLANVRLTYHHESFSASWLTKYVGSFYTDNFKDPDNKNDAYVVSNLELLYGLPHAGDVQVTVRAEVRNIMNKLYFMNGEGNAFFPAAERNYLVGLTLSL